MAFDFNEIDISINSQTLNWGPFLFNFWTAVPDPTGNPIESVVVKSFLGEVESTAQLIASSSLASVEDAVNVWFSYPGAEWAGEHTLQFDVVLESGGTNRFTFGYVVVS